MNDVKVGYALTILGALGLAGIMLLGLFSLHWLAALAGVCILLIVIGEALTE